MSDLLGGGQKKAQRKQQAAQQTRLRELDAAQVEQRKVTAGREEATAKAEKAQRRVRSGRRRGLLAFTDDSLGSQL